MKVVTGAAFASFLAMSAPVTLMAQESPPSGEDSSAPQDVIVYGRALPQIGEALSGSSGTVGYRDLENRPFSRVGELAETVPGLIATQHSGSGKANQYFLRGFNLDHGTDLAGFVDGVPINMPSHGHGQGYLDLNFLIPELVEKIEYRKGPYFADVGDFSSAGSVGFGTKSQLTQPIVQLTTGSFGYGRALAAGSTAIGSSTLLAAIKGVRSNGPWTLDENLRKLNGFVKISSGGDTDRTSLALSAYDARWTSTDQVPLRAIRENLIGRLGYIDPDLGGRTTRLSATLNMTRGDWRATAYAIFYDFALTSNFTYFLDDPVHGDEFRQRDKRGVFGGSIEHSSFGGIWGIPVALTTGAEARYDRIAKLGLYHSEAGHILSTIKQDQVDEASAALFGQAQLFPTPHFRLILGVRADLYHVDVASDLTANSGRKSDALIASKMAAAWQIAEPLELYADYGESFHSNDARGATIRVDPSTGAATEQVGLLARARGEEIGARLERPSFTASIALYRLALASELIFAGDDGSTEASAASRRSGIEATAFWRPERWVAIDVSGALTRARLRDVPDGEDRIPNALSHVLAAGISVDPLPQWSLSLRLRHFGSAPLIEDGSARSRPTTLLNLGGYWQHSRKRVELEVFNLLGSKANDITYFYASRLPGEPAEGVEDYHLHPVEPRQIRVSFRASF